MIVFVIWLNQSIAKPGNKTAALPIFKESSAKCYQICMGSNELTHWPLVTPYGDMDLGQHWPRLWHVA